MTTINMRIFRTVIVLVIALITVQGHVISNLEVQKEKTSSLSTDLEKIPSIKEPTAKEPTAEESKPEISSSSVKPEIPSPDLKPESEPAAPATPQNLCSSLDRDCESKPENHLEQNQVDYDQRQNGSENYRIHVDGLVLVVAPMEALLLAGGLGSDMNKVNMSSALDQEIMKTVEQSSNLSKPELEKPSQSGHRPMFYAAPKRADGPVSIKLINLIAPLLEQRRH